MLVVKVQISDWTELGAAPRAVCYFYAAGPVAILPVAHKEAIAAPQLSNHCIGTSGSIGVQVACLVEVLRHAVAASNSATSPFEPCSAMLALHPKRTFC